MKLDDYLLERREAVDRELDRLLPAAEAPPDRIHAAMRYSVFAGGKRIRPLLAISSAEACGLVSGSETAACALECVHTYSLIHDDLPALDNDDFRRGKPTCHKAFGEATAILAGDALLTLAFEILAGLEQPTEVRAALVSELAEAAGTRGGMIAGQVADLEAEGRRVTSSELEFIHRAKTAALIRASVLFGAILAGADGGQREALRAYGDQVGLAFQIVDDVLDEVASSEQLGKTAGKDRASNKATFPAVEGIEGSTNRASQCLEAALQALDCFGEKASPLRDLASLVVHRKN